MEGLTPAVGTDGGGSSAANALASEAAAIAALGRYQPLRYIGRGTNGLVVLSMHKATGEPVAIKFVECK